MNATAAYNEAVRRHFADPQHAGKLQKDHDLTLVADVSESAEGAHIVMSVGIRGDTIAAAFKKLSSRGLSVIPVLEGERLVGIVTMQNLLHSITFLSRKGAAAFQSIRRD